MVRLAQKGFFEDRLEAKLIDPGAAYTMALGWDAFLRSLAFPRWPPRTQTSAPTSTCVDNFMDFGKIADG